MIVAYRANVVHSLGLNNLQVLAPGLVGVDSVSKTIKFVHDESSSASAPHFDKLVDLGSKLLLPGFVDGHAHAPQHSFVGVGMHLPLLEWLDTHTFPSEAKFSDPKYARAVYAKAVRRHLLNGTTTCSYFATVHLEGCKALADVAEELGQRALVGKVNMDRNCSTPELMETTHQSVDATREFVDYVLGKKNPLVAPVLTPRFVPSTTSELMTKLGEISREHEPKLRVQSHLSENRAEIQWVKELHPESENYTAVYKDHGLLHDRTYMAHCVWCGSKEREMLKDSGAGVIHCANSNFSLSSGVLNVRRLLDEGVKVGLGTDVSGGYSPSMLDALRQAVIASKLVAGGGGSDDEDSASSTSSTSSSYAPLTFAEAFHLATQGGAEALALGDVVGNFLPGKEFDALVVDPYVDDGAVDAPAGLADEPMDVQRALQQFLFLGDDRNIRAIFVRGRQVLGSLK